MQPTAVVYRIEKPETLAGELAVLLEPLLSQQRFGLAPRVAIKPNLTYPFHKPGVTTSPAFLRALIQVLSDYTPHISICESDGGSHAWTAQQAFDGHEVDAICKRFGATAQNLSGLPAQTRTATVAGCSYDIELPALLLQEIDCFITVPVPKLHVMTGVSLGFKNQWGCLPDVKRLKHHHEFAPRIIGINKLLRTRLAVFDASYFLDRSGPMEGVPVRKNLVVAGEVGAATAACCWLMHVDPHTVEHLSLAIREGLMPEVCALDVPEEWRHACVLRRKPTDYAALAVFKSATWTNFLYNSWVAKPAHDLVYMIKGRPVDFKPKW